MAAPYVCISCRTKLLLPRIRPSRLISYTTADRTTTQIRKGNGPERVFDRRAGNEGENAPIRGRYSGKELRPEQLLSFLDDVRDPRPQSRPRPRPAARPKHPQARPTHLPFTPDDRNVRPAYRNRNVLRNPLPSDMEDKLRLLATSTDKQDLPRAWGALSSVARLCPQLSDDQLRRVVDQEGVRKAIHTLAWNTIRQWLDELTGTPVTKTLPSPSEFFATLRLLRIARGSLYRPPLWQAASSVFEMNLSQDQLTGALKELVNMWRFSMAARLAPASPSDKISYGHGRTVAIEDASDWSFLPPTTIFEPLLRERRTRAMFEEMLNMLVVVPLQNAEKRPDPRSMDYASPAILTLDMLRHDLLSSHDPGIAPNNIPEAMPFIELLEAMLKLAPAPGAPIFLREKLATKKNSEHWDKYVTTCHRMNLDGVPDVPSAVHMATKTSEASRDSKPTESGSTESAETDVDGTVSAGLEPDHLVDHLVDPKNAKVDPLERFTILSISRLGRAVEQQNTSMVDKIRLEILGYAGTYGEDTTALSLDLYEALIRAYASLKNQKRAVEIWTHIIKSGYKPTTKTYTIMMRGAQAIRDVSGMEAFWKSMRQNGLQPDSHAWSVRVFGILRQRNALEQGLRTLNEMGREWLIAAQAQATQDASLQKKQTQSPSAMDLIRQFPGSVNGVPRPDLVVMNSAISALTATNDSAVPRVLTWGRSFGVEPDLITYNALLNVSMRHDKADEALKILQRMHARGVEADTATWTILLTAMFQNGFLENLTPAQQQEKILGLIDALQNKELGMAGIDDKAYALIIDRLIKSYSNQAAASAVLTHMINSGRQPTAHIYTILVTSYFQRQPQPDFAAVEVLLKQIAARNNGWGSTLDTVFYDRIIEGYAANHRIVGMQPAMSHLRRAKQAGHKPGWGALSSVAHALAERGDWPRLKALVDDVRATLRDTRGAAAHRQGQQKFWELIIETGILREEGITKTQQLFTSAEKVSPLMSAASAS